tara:strand:+ start:143 stop:367 length:225 start_codon:yes stop_codon:yes gene_type:complete
MAKKKEIYYGKGFKRIYFSLSAIWIICIGFVYLGMVGDYLSGSAPIMALFGLILVLAPIPAWFILKWFIEGFKK